MIPNFDFFTLLSRNSGVSLEVIRTAAVAALPEGQVAGNLTDQQATQVVVAMLHALRQELPLTTLMDAAEDYLDDDAEHEPSSSPWWQDLRQAPEQSVERLVGKSAGQGAEQGPGQNVGERPQAAELDADFEAFYQNIVSSLPVSLPPCTDYLDVWQNDKKSFLDQSISRLSKDLLIASADDIAGDLGGIADDFLFGQRCAEDCELRLSAQFLGIAHDICLLAISKGVHLNEDELTQFEHALLRCIDIIWEIRTFVANGGDERQYWLNPVSRQNFLSVRAKLATIRSVLEAAS